MTFPRCLLRSGAPSCRAALLACSTRSAGAVYSTHSPKSRSGHNEGPRGPRLLALLSSLCALGGSAAAAADVMSEADIAQLREVAAKMGDASSGVARALIVVAPGQRALPAFTDAAAAQWLLASLPEQVKTAEEAAALGQRLVDAHLIAPVVASAAPAPSPQAAAFNPSDPQKLKMLVSQAPPPAKGQALNTHFAWVGPARPAPVVTAELRRLILRLYGSHLSDDGRAVNYRAMASDPLFRAYVDAAAELQAVDLAPLSREELLCMFINLYNALIIHAHVVMGAPKSSLERLAFFSKVARYNIGGVEYSADDMENGVLRGNRTPPADLFAVLGLPQWGRRPFGPQDARAAKVVEPVDARIHFALVCGAKSCPPIQLYTPERLEMGLQAAAKAFCSGEVEVDQGKHEVRLSKIFQWYAVDFGSSSRERLQYLLPFLPQAPQQALRAMLDSGKAIKVKYNPYDWTVNTTDS